MNNADFVRHMESMRAHYKTHPSRSYPLPIATAARRLNEDDLPDAAKAIISEQQGAQSAFYGNNQTKITEITDEFKENEDRTEFEKKMNERREEAREEADELIDEAFDKLIEVGKDAPPREQDAILAAADSVNSFLTELLSGFVEWVVDFVEEVVKSIVGAIEAIEEFFSDIGDEIGEFFEGIFDSAVT